jgi:hypothetical protein
MQNVSPTLQSHGDIPWLLNNASSAAEAVYLTLQDDYKL